MAQLPDSIVQRHKQQDETIKLDKEGNWFHGDYPILHDRTVQFFNRNIARNPQGRYFLTGEDKPVFFEVEDVPFFIKKVEKTIVGFLIYLTDESIELLDLASLSVGEDNALYCLVKGGEFVAKFFRPPYMEISKFILPEGKDFVLQFGSKKYTLAKGKPTPEVEFIEEDADKVSPTRKPKKAVAHLTAKVKIKEVAKKKAPERKKAKPSQKAPKKAISTKKLVKKSAKKSVKKPVKKNIKPKDKKKKKK
ncbi:MAG: hypothetical protein ACD_73C00610G0002 [uncultured bacterium]|nr:MAG: hypothetical protein ACD_73C00610G0002 [uncultured bacterium]